jgi:sec-independent protein translocase protein TatB
MSFLETLVILLVAMVVLGPKRLPQAARKIGKITGAIRRAGEEFHRQLLMMDEKIEQSVNLDELMPTDEEQAIMDGTATSATPSIPEGTPPDVSLDDLWDTPPRPGGFAPSVTDTIVHEQHDAPAQKEEANNG